MLIKELFTPVDQDSTEMLEKIAAIGIQALLDELLDERKAIYKYLSVSGSEYSWEHCPDEVKKDMLGVMASNDLAESSFAGVTAQVQCYGRIGMCNAAAVSDTARNEFLARPTTKKEIAEDKRGLFHGLPEELKITATIVAMEDAPATRQSNNDSLERQRDMRKKKEELARQKGLEDAEDAYIEALIYHKMGSSESCWRTISDVTSGLKNLKYKKDQLAALKDNFKIGEVGWEWKECKTQYSEKGVQKSIAVLANRLKELIRLEKRNKWEIPEQPRMILPQRKAVPILGQLTDQVKQLDQKASEHKHNSELDTKARMTWKKREEQGIGSVNYNMQQHTAAPELELGMRIEVLVNFDLDEAGTEQAPRWCSGVIERISDGTWLLPKARTKCYKKDEAAEILWDPVPEAELSACRSIQVLNPRLWNQNCKDAWRRDLGEVDYGL